MLAFKHKTKPLSIIEISPGMDLRAELRSQFLLDDLRRQLAFVEKGDMLGNQSVGFRQFADHVVLRAGPTSVVARSLFFLPSAWSNRLVVDRRSSGARSFDLLTSYGGPSTISVH